MDLKQLISKKYTGMRDKCHNKKHPQYWKFGEKGVKVCEEWLNSYQKFYQWAIDNKLNNENKHIFRHDDSKGFSPENCYIGKLDEFAAKQGWRQYNYNEKHQLKGKSYFLPDWNINIINVDDDAFILRIEVSRYFDNNDAFIKILNKATDKLCKEEKAYDFHKEIILDDKVPVKFYMYNSEELEALKPYMSFSEETFMKYMQLIKILEEWNEQTLVEINSKKEDEEVIEVVKESRNETVHAPTKVELISKLMELCSDKEKTMPLTKLNKLAKIDAEIEKLKEEKASIIKE